MALTDFLTQIADSIRSKDGTTEPIVATDFPQRILDIPSGTDEKCAKGTFTLNESTNSLTIEHGISIIPELIVLITNTNSLIVDEHSISGIIHTSEIGRDFVMYGRNNSVRVILQYLITDMTETQFTISSSTYSLLQGVEYIWYAVGGVT